MSIQLFKNLLADLKRSNKKRKLVLAERAGYTTVEKYEEYLKNQIAGNITEDVKVAKPAKTTKKATPIIHIVDIIDCSGSMGGSKIRNAVEGINNGILKLQEDKKVNYTYSLCDFSDANDIRYSHIKTPIIDVKPIYFTDRGLTALFDAIGTTLDKIKSGIKKEEKVLVNIYTDGGENGSRKYNYDKVSELIESLKDTFTVTFIGTDRDVDLVVKNLKIDKSNTLAYDGSAKGLAQSMSVNSQARSTYSKAVTDGLDVSKGFYKNVVKK